MQDDRSWATLADVAAASGVSVDTIRRRIRRGELDGRREQTPQGFRWLAPLPDANMRTSAPDAVGSPESHERPFHDVALVQHAQDALIETLQHELALRNREISRLHDVIASQAQALQLTAGGNAPTPAPEPDAPVSAAPAMIEPHATGVRARVRRWITR
jgi:hypothetical protein